MGLVVRLPTVSSQILEIVDYIATDSLIAALNWLDAIEAAFDMLSSQPLLGQELQTKHLGTVRCHVVGAYVIYYKPISGGVEILRVLHGARDLNRLT